MRIQKSKPRQQRKEKHSVEAPKSLVDAATDTIRDRIIDLTLPPGQLINSAVLGETLGLSRTPVREALNRLATEGLITFETNQGVYVNPLDISGVYQLCEAFRVCENISVHFCDLSEPELLKDIIAAQETQRDALRKHSYLDASYWNFRQRVRLSETCRNKHLLDFYTKIANQMRRLSVLVYRMEATNHDFYLAQVSMLEGLHRELQSAIQTKQKESVRESLMHHLDVFQERIAKVIKSNRGRDISFF